MSLELLPGMEDFPLAHDCDRSRAKLDRYCADRHLPRKYGGNGMSAVDAAHRPLIMVLAVMAEHIVEMEREITRLREEIQD